MASFLASFPTFEIRAIFMIRKSVQVRLTLPLNLHTTAICEIIPYDLCSGKRGYISMIHHTCTRIAHHLIMDLNPFPKDEF